MKRLGYAIAALGVIAVAAPSIASAETGVIKRGGHHDWERARAEYRGNRGPNYATPTTRSSRRPWLPLSRWPASP